MSHGIIGVAQEPFVSSPDVVLTADEVRQRAAHKKRKADHRRKAGRTERSRNEMWESEAKAWEALATEPVHRRVIFDKIEIADDGGIRDIGPGKKEDLWSRSRYFSMVLMLAFIIYNVTYIAYTDIEIIGNAGNETDGGQYFLVVNWLVKEISNGKVEIKSSWSSAVVAIIELSILALVFLVMGFHLLGVCCRRGYVRWHSVHKLLKERLPDLASFSAMQLLYYVNTSIVSNDVFYALFYAPPRWRIPNLLWLLFTRPICLIVGLDCFLIKYRAASDSILTGVVDFNNVLSAFLLLNQILGVVRLNWAVRDRLFRFVFGGEDGVMTPREVVRMKIWQALVTQRVFHKYPWYQAFALCLTWNDDDFQLLILDEPDIHESQLSQMDVNLV